MPAGQRPVRRATVLETERLSAGMVRVVLGGGGLSGFDAGDFTDRYVKLALPAPGADYGSDFDAQEIQATRPRELWPRTRTYTVRAWDPEAERMTIDVVVHGDAGVAGPWAARARPGDTLQLRGPGGGYAPDPGADWHLLVGDASVIPAISAALAEIGAGVPIDVVIEVDGPEEEQPLAADGDLRLRWRHRTRDPGEEPELLRDAVAALALGTRPGTGVRPRRGELRARRAPPPARRPRPRARGAVGLGVLEAAPHG